MSEKGPIGQPTEHTIGGEHLLTGAQMLLLQHIHHRSGLTTGPLLTKLYSGGGLFSEHQGHCHDSGHCTGVALIQLYQTQRFFLEILHTLVSRVCLPVVL